MFELCEMIEVHQMRKEHIAKLFHQLTFFLPKMENGNFYGEFLVNQIAVNKAKGQAAESGHPMETLCPPERDTLIDLIGKAGIEMKLFMAEFDAALERATVYAHAIEIIDKHFNAMLAGDDTREMTTIEKLERIQGRYEQMASFVADIANGRDESIPMRVYKTAEFLNNKINAKKEVISEPVLLPDPTVLPAPAAPATGGNDSLGSGPIPSPDAGGVEAQGSDSH